MQRKLLGVPSTFGRHVGRQVKPNGGMTAIFEQLRNVSILFHVVELHTNSNPAISLQTENTLTFVTCNDDRIIPATYSIHKLDNFGKEIAP